MLSNNGDMGRLVNQWPLALPCVGRYVRVQLNGTNFLHFAELQVFTSVDVRVPERLPSSLRPPPGGDAVVQHGKHMFSTTTGPDTGHFVDDGTLGCDLRSLVEEPVLMVDHEWIGREAAQDLRILLGTIPDVEPVRLFSPQPFRVRLTVVEDASVDWDGAFPPPHLSAPAVHDESPRRRSRRSSLTNEDDWFQLRSEGSDVAPCRDLDTSAFYKFHRARNDDGTALSAAAAASEVAGRGRSLAGSRSYRRRGELRAKPLGKTRVKSFGDFSEALLEDPGAGPPRSHAVRFSPIPDGDTDEISWASVGDDKTRETPKPDNWGTGPEVDAAWAHFTSVMLLQIVPSDVLEKIGQSMTRVTFSAGDIIIKQGDPRISFWYLVSGSTVAVTRMNPNDPSSVERDLSHQSAREFIGQSAILTGGIRTATVTAVTDVVAMKCSRDTFIQAVGEGVYKAMRRAAIKNRSMVTLNAMRRERKHASQRGKLGTAVGMEDGGDAHARTVPMHWQTGDVHVFHTNLPALRSHGAYLQLEILSVGDDDENDPDSARRVSAHQLQLSDEVLGVVYLVPSMFAASRGQITAPILSPTMGAGVGRGGPIVGLLDATFLIINAMDHPNNNLSSVWRTKWRDRDTLDVGHRGMGKSHHQARGFRLAMFKENTLMSFVMAARAGADFIEFDVQLTSDRVPVIYHDFMCEVALAEEDVMAQEAFTMGIHQLTARQLSRVVMRPLETKNVLLRRLVNKHRGAIHSIYVSRFGCSDSDGVDSPSSEGASTPTPPHPPRRQRMPRLMTLMYQLPTLEALFKSVPAHVGFNVEVKYPAESHEEPLRRLDHFEINAYVDTILDCVFTHAASRRIIFSCFDPDVCTLLHAKQARYPVVFLTCSGVDVEYVDSRCLSLQAALDFAKGENLQGIAAQSNPLLEQPELIRKIKREGLLLFTWGDMNTDPENVAIQKRHGVDGVISDNVGDINRSLGKARSVFQRADSRAD